MFVRLGLGKTISVLHYPRRRPQPFWFSPLYIPTQELFRSLKNIFNFKPALIWADGLHFVGWVKMALLFSLPLFAGGRPDFYLVDPRLVGGGTPLMLRYVSFGSVKTLPEHI